MGNWCSMCPPHWLTVSLREHSSLFRKRERKKKFHLWLSSCQSIFGNVMESRELDCESGNDVTGHPPSLFRDSVDREAQGKGKRKRKRERELQLHRRVCVTRQSRGIAAWHGQSSYSLLFYTLYPCSTRFYHNSSPSLASQALICFICLSATGSIEGNLVYMSKAPE